MGLQSVDLRGGPRPAAGPALVGGGGGGGAPLTPALVKPSTFALRRHGSVRASLPTYYCLCLAVLLLWSIPIYLQKVDVSRALPGTICTRTFVPGRMPALFCFAMRPQFARLPGLRYPPIYF